MFGLAPKADEVVRDAVDAFMEGRRVVEHDGETLLETKNSRYRVLDGILFSAPDTTLHGAEFVGWLCDDERRSAVDPAWQPGLRAIFVDRKRGRHIIITSTILDVSGVPLHSVESELEPSFPYALQRRREDDRAARAPAPLVAATPLPPQVAAPIPPSPPAPQRPIASAQGGPPVITSATRPPPPPPRRAAVPAPIAALAWSDARASLPSPARPSPAPLARPLPFPSPPPRRGVTPIPPAPAPLAPALVAPIDSPAADPSWSAPDSLPIIDAPEPLSTGASWPRVAPAEEPSLLASSDVLDAIDPSDDDDEDTHEDIEQTEPTSPPFLLDRPAAAVPAPPASQPGNEPFLLGRPLQRNVPMR
jgi:hypothetical protein